MEGGLSIQIAHHGGNRGAGARSLVSRPAFFFDLLMKMGPSSLPFSLKLQPLHD